MPVDTPSLYRDELLSHYRRPHNYGDLEGADVTRRGSNPRCGDEIEIGICFDGDRLTKVAFRGRGCAICIASASMMTEGITGQCRGDAGKLASEINAWFNTAEAHPATSLPEPLQALTAVRAYPERKRCVLLAWEALDAALTSGPA